MKEQRAEILNKLDEISSTMSLRFSTVARNVVITLCGLTWLELFGTKESPNSNKDIILISVILLVIAYFIFDILQYYISCRITNANWYKYKRKYLTVEGVNHSMNSLNRYTYRMLYAKITVLAIIFILLFIYYVKEYLI